MLDRNSRFQSYSELGFRRQLKSQSALLHNLEEAMSRRSNSTKLKKNAGGAASSSSGARSLAEVQSSESASTQRESLAASLLDAFTAAGEVDGVFSDYGGVNKEILESVSSTFSSPEPSASIAAKEMALPGSSRIASTTTVPGREPRDLDVDVDADFGADIFFDDEPAAPQTVTYGELSEAVLRELKASESDTWDEISPEDYCFDDNPCFEQPSSGEYSIQQSEIEDADTGEGAESDRDADKDLEDSGEGIVASKTLEPCSQNASLNESSFSAIDAAVEILSQTIDCEEIESVPSCDFHERERHPEPALTEPRDSTGGSLKSELKELTETLRQEFRQSLESLQASQAAANAAQSEVLKTLTEIMFQSAGSRDIPVDAIEKAISGVEERIVSRLEAMAGSFVPAENTPAGTSPGPAVTRTGNGSSMKLQNAASSVTRSWEQIKSEMMNKGELVESSPASKPQKPTAALPEVAQLTSDRHFRLPEQDLSLEIPKAVDPEAVSDEELREAFREREAFITTLIARIRRQQESATGQLSPDQLRTLAEELPDELAEQVRYTLKQMDDLARMGELELSLERARIARQVNQLAHSRHLLERNARQMGMIVNADGSIVQCPNQAGRSTGSRRWLGKLGFGQ